MLLEPIARFMSDSTEPTRISRSHGPADIRPIHKYAIHRHTICGYATCAGGSGEVVVRGSDICMCSSPVDGS